MHNPNNDSYNDYDDKYDYVQTQSFNKPISIIKPKNNISYDEFLNQYIPYTYEMYFFQAINLIPFLMAVWTFYTFFKNKDHKEGKKDFAVIQKELIEKLKPQFNIILGCAAIYFVLITLLGIGYCVTYMGNPVTVIWKILLRTQRLQSLLMIIGLYALDHYQKQPEATNKDKDQV